MCECGCKTQVNNPKDNQMRPHFTLPLIYYVFIEVNIALTQTSKPKN